jgi:S1-C subfamily serine protease
VKLLKQKTGAALLAAGFFAWSPEAQSSAAQRQPGAEMIQDLNKDPVFRAATVQLAGEISYGSGSITRNPLSILTAGHVYDSFGPEEYITITVPGCAAFRGPKSDFGKISRTNEVTVRMNAGATFTDDVVRILPADKVKRKVQECADTGKIALLSVSNSLPKPGTLTYIPRADTGRKTLGVIVKVGGPLIALSTEATLSDGSKTQLGNLCQGRSGQPLLDSTNRVLGVFSFIINPQNDIILQQPGACSQDAFFVSAA